MCGFLRGCSDCEELGKVADALKRGRRGRPRTTLGHGAEDRIVQKTFTSLLIVLADDLSQGLTSRLWAVLTDQKVLV